MQFKLTKDAKLTIINTLAGIVGGAISFYLDRGALNMGTTASILAGLIVLAGAAYLEKYIFKDGDVKHYFTQGAFIYILSWLLMNGILTTF